MRLRTPNQRRVGTGGKESEGLRTFNAQSTWQGWQLNAKHGPSLDSGERKRKGGRLEKGRKE